MSSSKDKKNHDTLVNEALELSKKGNYEDAIKKLEEAVKIIPFVATYIRLANLLSLSDRYMEALEIYNEAEKLLNDDRDAVAEISYYKSICYDIMGKYEEMFVAVNKAIDGGIKVGECYYFLGEYYDENRSLDKENENKAIENYLKAIEIDTSLLYAYANLSHIYYEQQKYEEALELLLKLKDLDKDHLTNVEFNLGVIYACLNDYDNAMKYYKKELELDNPYAKVYFNMGTLNKDFKMYDKAKYYFLKAIEQNKDDVDSWYNLGCVYALENDCDNALSCLQYVKYHKYEYFKESIKDPDLKEIIKDERYKKMCEKI